MESDFNLSDYHLREFFCYFILLLSILVLSFFQFKVLNNILYTNKQLFKIGYRIDDVCTFSKAEPETLYHILCQCPYSRHWLDIGIFLFPCL